MKKNIIITGVSSGIGLALAKKLSAEGHQVFGISRSGIHHPDIISIQADITSYSIISTEIQKIISEYGPIDVLINNAGMGMVGPVENAKPEEIEQLFALNLTGAVSCMQAVLPGMRARNFGQMINISSIGSEMGLPFRGFYSASKAALDRVTEAMRYEVFPWGIQVCVLHLGDIQTPIAKGRVVSEVSNEYSQVFDQVHRLMNAHVDAGASPEEVARYVSALLNKKSWKAHYYFGKLGQKIGVPLKWILPQKFYESLMRKYNGM